jgi:hypothetical protein
MRLFFTILQFSEIYIHAQHKNHEQCRFVYNFLTFRVEPATPQFSHQTLLTMQCLKSLCNGGDSLNKLNQLMRTTFPLIEVDLPNAKPTSASNRILQEMRLGCLLQLLLLISTYLFY